MLKVFQGLGLLSLYLSFFVLFYVWCNWWAYGIFRGVGTFVVLFVVGIFFLGLYTSMEMRLQGEKEKHITQTPLSEKTAPSADPGSVNATSQKREACDD